MGQPRCLARPWPLSTGSGGPQSIDSSTLVMENGTGENWWHVADSWVARRFGRGVVGRRPGRGQIKPPC